MGIQRFIQIALEYFIIREVVRVQDVSVIVGISGIDQIGEHLVLCQDKSSIILVKELLVPEIVQRSKHRAVEHIMPIHHGNSVVHIGTVLDLGVDRARELILAINIVLQIKAVVAVGCTAGNRIVHSGIRDIDPRVDIGIDLHQLIKAGLIVIQHGGLMTPRLRRAGIQMLSRIRRGQCRGGRFITCGSRRERLAVDIRLIEIADQKNHRSDYDKDTYTKQRDPQRFFDFLHINSIRKGTE